MPLSLSLLLDLRDALALDEKHADEVMARMVVRRRHKSFTLRVRLFWKGSLHRYLLGKQLENGGHFNLHLERPKRLERRSHKAGVFLGYHLCSVEVVHLHSHGVLRPKEDLCERRRPLPFTYCKRCECALTCNCYLYHPSKER